MLFKIITIFENMPLDSMSLEQSSSAISGLEYSCYSNIRVTANASRLGPAVIIGHFSVSLAIQLIIQTKDFKKAVRFSFLFCCQYSIISAKAPWVLYCSFINGLFAPLQAEDASSLWFPLQSSSGVH